MVQFWGCSKTASKAYMYMLNEHSDINISNEMHVLPSLSKHKFFIQYLKYFFHKDKNRFAESLQYIADATYWKQNSYNKNKYKRIINNHPHKLSFADSVKFLMRLDADLQNKSIEGAKFLAHIIYFPILYRKQEGKFIFLGRLPVDIYKSQINKHNAESLFKRLLMIFWVSAMFNLTVFYYALNRHKRNTLLLKYEDFNHGKEQVIKCLCDFLDIEFRQEMLELPTRGSFVKGKKNVKKVGLIDRKLIEVLTFFHSLFYRKYQMK